jgi:hypothetical protein
MYVGSKERLLDLENTWPIYRGFIYRLACLQEERCAHGSSLTEARCSLQERHRYPPWLPSPRTACSTTQIIFARTGAMNCKQCVADLLLALTTSIA